MKAFVRLDAGNKVIPGSNISRKAMPKIGKWREIDISQCCTKIITLPSYDFGLMTAGCIFDDGMTTYYFNGENVVPSLGDTIYIDSEGKTVIPNGQYGWSDGNLFYAEVIGGVIQTIMGCGR